jgi:UPF0755 protein
MNIPVKLAFNNQERLKTEIVFRYLTSFKDSIFLKENGFTKENVLVMFIPNTYEFYWNTTADKFRDKMIKEYRNFWIKNVLQKQSSRLTQWKRRYLLR